jgi:hypothetical protein
LGIDALLLESNSTDVLSGNARPEEEPAMAARENLFADIDSMEPDRFAAHLAQDVTFRFGNAEPVVGRAAVRDVWAGFCETVDGVSHAIVEQFVAPLFA